MMRFAINPSTTLNYEFDVDVAAYHAAGITHMKFWIDKLDRYMEQHELVQVRELLSSCNLTMVAALCAVDIMLTDVTSNKEQMREFQRKLALCRDVYCSVMIFIPENPDAENRDVYDKVERNLQRACEVAEDHNVKLALGLLQGNRLCVYVAFTTSKLSLPSPTTRNGCRG